MHGARSLFGSSKASGCRAGHPQTVLEGLVQALHQVPADFNQGDRNIHHTAFHPEPANTADRCIYLPGRCVQTTGLPINAQQTFGS